MWPLEDGSERMLTDSTTGERVQHDEWKDLKAKWRKMDPADRKLHEDGGQEEQIGEGQDEEVGGDSSEQDE